MLAFACGRSLLDFDGAIVIPVNTVGVMGAGLAKAAAQRFPEVVRPYQQACQAGSLRIGAVLVERVRDGRPVVLLATKVHWRNPSTLEYVRLGMQSLLRSVDEYGFRDVAIPRLGCGLGGLTWDAVRPIIVDACAARPNIQFVVF